MCRLDLKGLLVKVLGLWCWDQYLATIPDMTAMTTKRQKKDKDSLNTAMLIYGSC